STGSRAESFVVDTHKPACLVYYWTWLPSMELEQERDAGARTSWPGPLPLNRSADLEIPPRFRIDFGFLLDPLSSIMILVITGVGFLIHVYSIGYMAHDPGFARYFAYLNLFTAMMLTLVLGSSFLVMFVGWEGVGLCSYLLIGFWYSDEEKAQAGRKAFITNRI